MLDVMFNKKQNERAKTLKDENERTLLAANEWLKVTPISDISAIFASMVEEAAAVAKPNKLDKDSKRCYEAVIDQIKSIGRLWMQIDTQTISDSHKIYMYNCLNSSSSIRLSPILMNYATNTARFSLVPAYENKLTDGTDSVKRRLGDIVGILHQIKRLQQVAFYSLEKPVRSTTLSFPKLSTDNRIIANRLSQLEELWALASDNKNSVEDEYILEEIVNSYLPEAWKMYSTFRLAKKEYRVQAEQIMVEQIRLLESKVQSVLDSSFKASLAALNAQTDFLRARTEEENLFEENIRSVQAF